MCVPKLTHILIQREKGWKETELGNVKGKTRRNGASEWETCAGSIVLGLWVGSRHMFRPEGRVHDGSPLVVSIDLAIGIAVLPMRDKVERKKRRERGGGGK